MPASSNPGAVVVHCNRICWWTKLDAPGRRICWLAGSPGFTIEQAVYCSQGMTKVDVGKVAEKLAKKEKGKGGK